MARFGHAFHAAFEPLEVVVEQWGEIRAECETVGRDPNEVELSLRVYLDPGEAMPSDKSIAGSPEQMLATICKLEKAGVTHVLLDPVGRGGAAGRLEVVRNFMEDVAPQA